MDKYVCDVCGYEYDPAVGDPDNGVAPGTYFVRVTGKGKPVTHSIIIK